MNVIIQLSKEAGRDYPERMEMSKAQFVGNLIHSVRTRLQLRDDKDTVDVQFVEKELLP
jgi:hypothetical protein